MGSQTIFVTYLQLLTLRKTSSALLNTQIDRLPDTWQERDGANVPHQWL